jgi:hypothetical protein
LDQSSRGQEIQEQGASICLASGEGLPAASQHGRGQYMVRKSKHAGEDLHCNKNIPPITNSSINPLNHLPSFHLSTQMHWKPSFQHINFFFLVGGHIQSTADMQ